VVAAALMRGERERGKKDTGREREEKGKKENSRFPNPSMFVG
jgi:hypothetical protein